MHQGSLLLYIELDSLINKSSQLLTNAWASPKITYPLVEENVPIVSLDNITSSKILLDTKAPSCWLIRLDMKQLQLNFKDVNNTNDMVALSLEKFAFAFTRLPEHYAFTLNDNDLLYTSTLYIKANAIIIENMSSKNEFPVVLRSPLIRDLNTNDNNISINNPTFRCILGWTAPIKCRNMRTPTKCTTMQALCFKQADWRLISMELQPTLIHLEDASIFHWIRSTLAIVNNFKEFNAHQLNNKISNNHNNEEIKDFIDDSITNERNKILNVSKLFIHHIRISKLELEITIHASNLSSNVPVFLAVRKLPISLSSVQMSGVFCSNRRLIREILSLYVSDAIVHSPAMLGSLDIIGNPTALVTSIMDGFGDLVSLPQNAATKGPSAVVLAVGNGVISLFRRISEGTLTSLSAFTSSIARNLEYLGPQDLYTKRRQFARTLHPNSATHGMWSGITSFSQSIIGGLSGAVTAPVNGATKNGTLGFIGGVGSGLVGIVTKPIAGVLDFVSQTSAGLASTTSIPANTYSQMFQRRLSQKPYQIRNFTILQLRVLAASMNEAYLTHSINYEQMQFLSTNIGIGPGKASSAPPPVNVCLTLVTSVGIHIFQPTSTFSSNHDDLLKYTIYWREVLDFQCMIKDHCIIFKFKNHLIKLSANNNNINHNQNQQFLNIILYIYDYYQHALIN